MFQRTNIKSKKKFIHSKDAVTNRQIICKIFNLAGNQETKKFCTFVNVFYCTKSIVMALIL